MYCSNCGKEIKENAKFCHECGNKVENQEIISKEQEIVNVSNNIAIEKVDTNRVIDYFKKVILLETRKYALNKVINKLNKERIEGKSHKEKDFSYKFNKVGFGSVIGKTIRNFIISIVVIAMFHQYLCESILRLPSDSDTIGIIALVFMGIGLLFTIFSFIKYSIQRKNENKKIENEKINYSNDVDKYNAEVDAYNSTLDTQRKDLVERKYAVNSQLKDTKELLQKLYDLNIVHKKYQNFVAVATMCEYFETGRCNSFDGYTGAYNIYEQETRQDKIISRLEDILYSLEDIKKNQFVMYCAIQNGNNLANQLLKNTNELKQNADIIKENTEMIKFLEAYNNY